jgi:large subunit ribosomal protein L5
MVASKNDSKSPSPERKGGSKGQPRQDKGAAKTAAPAESPESNEPQGPRVPSRLQTLFVSEVGPKVLKEFELKNPHQLPRITKVVVSSGVGKYLENQKLKPEIRDSVLSTFSTITGQRAVMILAKKSVANFKVREGAPSAFMVTLRRDRMWHFLDRLIHLATPRIKDFRGVSDKAFDKAGNYSMGLSEQAVWPEINMANVNFSHGMHITVCIENSNPKMSRFLLSELGMPFNRPEDDPRKRK